MWVRADGEAHERVRAEGFKPDGINAVVVWRNGLLWHAQRLRYELRTPVPLRREKTDPEAERSAFTKPAIEKSYPNEPKQLMTLGMHLRKVLKDMNARRPVSFFLLLAMIIVLLLGTQIANHRDDPKQFALILSCLFVFFFAAMVYAVLDAGQIVRDHLREQRKVWHTTLGEEEFLAELGKRVREKRDS
ncbi:MAG: hypothetical protein SGI88_17765 [Candidatus Hydrogenedentes bacterium]|nr:hypothetical protein [Candidatus Hydrogenedentota bacterium]